MARPGDKGPVGGKAKLRQFQDEGDPVVFTSRTLEELTSPRLKEAFAVWQQQRAAPDQLPAAEAFDILDYGAAMGNINLLEVRPDPLDFIFRVHSANGAKYVGQDLTGRSIDGYPDPQYRDFIRATYVAAFESRQPQFIIGELITDDNRRLRWEAVVMPMQDGAGAVSRLIATFEILN